MTLFVFEAVCDAMSLNAHGRRLCLLLAVAVMCSSFPTRIIQLRGAKRAWLNLGCAGLWLSIFSNSIRINKFNSNPSAKWMKVTSGAISLWPKFIDMPRRNDWWVGSVPVGNGKTCRRREFITQQHLYASHFSSPSVRLVFWWHHVHNYNQL